MLKKKEELRKNKLLQEDLKAELEDLKRTRIFRGFLRYLENKKKSSSFSIENVDMKGDIVKEIAYRKGAYDQLRQIIGFFKNIEGGANELSFWREAEKGSE